MASNARWSRFTIIVLVLLAASASVKYRYIGVPGNDWHEAINCDGKGYFEYVRLFLFPAGHEHLTVADDAHPKPVIRHFSGAAVMMAPFVLAAHAYSFFNPGKPEDGYSLHYQAAVGLAALSWLAIGLFALRRVLLIAGFKDGTVALVLAICVLGTGLLAQVVTHPAMSHVYGFAAVAVLFRNAQRLIIAPSQGRLMVCAALLGLAALIRPVNALVVLALPVAAMNLTVDRIALRSVLRSRALFAGAVAFVATISVQNFLWWYQCGQFVVEPYPGEGFHWSRPEVLKSFFSPRNGLFFYWPLLLLAWPGMLVLWWRHRSAAVATAAFIIAFVYVTSSWWNWAYGDNFGQRTYLDILPVLAVPIAAALSWRRWFLRAAVLPVLALCALNVFQSWQYHNFILVPGQVDWPKYKHILFCTDPRHALKVGGWDELPRYAPQGWEVVGTTRASGPKCSIPVPDDAIDRIMLATIGLERSERTPGSSKDAMVALYLIHGTTERLVHRWRMNGVPDAPAIMDWHYNYHLVAPERGDTLVVKASEGDGFSVTRLDAELSVPR
ncbi:MAG: hypothetical protein IPL52_07455 [Flavobacteriales bacterium]|nr:hypothetical protein [Flavobacteriales bacterium]